MWIIVLILGAAAVVWLLRAVVFAATHPVRAGWCVLRALAHLLIVVAVFGSVGFVISGFLKGWHDTGSWVPGFAITLPVLVGASVLSRFCDRRVYR